MAEAISDAIITQHTDDVVLDLLIETAIVAIQEGRALHPNPLKEPIWWRRYFLDWVSDGLNEAAKVREEIDKHTDITKLRAQR